MGSLLSHKLLYQRHLVISNKHRHPLINNNKSGNDHRYSYFLDQIEVGLVGLDELAEVFQCQLHTSSGKTEKGDRLAINIDTH